MEESQEILLSSLQNVGVSISDLTTPATFVSVCAQCLNLLADDTASFPTCLPDSTIDKFKICTDMALAIKRLGYIGDVSYYMFLYPSEEDLYKLARFLVERLSESSKDVRIADPKDVNGERKVKEDDSNNLEDQTEKSEDASFCGSSTRDLGKDGLTTEEGKSGRGAFGNEETNSQRDDEHVQNSISLKDQSSSKDKVRYEKEKLQNQEKILMEEVAAKMSELQDLEEEFELLKTATEMAFDDQHPIDFYLEQLKQQVDAKKYNIVELKSQGDAFIKPLEEKKRCLEESLYLNIPEAQEKLQKLREVEQEKQSVLSEIRKREEEHSKLSADLDKQPKLPSRTSYVERIKEITKNSRKQDADIERILKETREVQLEYNSIQERLHRTYAVLDEIVCREAKKDRVGRQAYRLLTSIHDSFEQISEKILFTDRIQRETAELEKKLAAMATRSLNVDKLQADLDTIMKENEDLEQRLKDN